MPEGLFVMNFLKTVSTGPTTRSFPHVNNNLDEIKIMNSTEEIAKYSDNNSHYRSPTLARRAATELDEPYPKKSVKKDKKWSLGGLFRRRKKEVESESSSEEETPSKKGFLQRRRQRKEDKRKKRANKTLGHFDHIVVAPQHHGNNYLNGNKDHDDFGGILSDPTFGFSGYKIGGSNDRISSRDSRESLNKRQDINLSRGSIASSSLDSTIKKSRREKVKARVEAKRGRMKDESSSDEGSQRSTASSVTRFKSDDSLSRKDGTTSRRTRSARTERYNRRLTKEEEQLLNKEAEQKSAKIDADVHQNRVQVNRWVVVDDNPKSSYKPYVKPNMSFAPSASLPQKQFSGVSTIPPSHNMIHRTTSNLSNLSDQRHYFNSSHKVTNNYPNAMKNQTDVIQNIHRNYINSYHEKQREFNPEQRSFSYDCNINRSPTPSNEEQVLHVQFPLGKPIPKQRNPNLINNTHNYSNQSLQRTTPPPPPPRDPQRRLVTTNAQFENTRPMSYAFENGNQPRQMPTNQQASVDRSSSVRSFNPPPITHPNINRAHSFGWQNYRSNSEDHIAQANPPFMQHSAITRPASATPDAPQQRFIRRHPASDQYKYFAEKTPRSRKPIHIATTNMPENMYLSDSQVMNQSYSASKHPVNKASEFWKQKDMEEVKRKSQLLEYPKKEKPEIKLQKPNVTKKSEDKGIRKNLPVLNMPVKTADSMSSLSGNSDTSPLCSKQFFDQVDSSARPLSMVSEKSEVTDNNETSKNRKDIPAPPIRHCSRQSSSSSTENNYFNDEDSEKKPRKSSNLEDALDELEAIYKSLRLGDEDLLDGAERHDVHPAVTQKLLNKNLDTYVNWGTPREAQSDSGFNYDDNFDMLRKKRLYRKSTVPDKVNDDMAYRRLNKERPPPMDEKTAVSQISYLLASPLLENSSHDENDNENIINDNEPDITLDDVVYRNIKQKNNTLKIQDPQLPFGIPVGPITGASNSDYLHAVPENRNRSRFIPQKSPDVVKDDLAYRNLRKDHSSFFTEDYLNNNNTKSNDYALKKRRAVRSISANIYNMMHKDSLRASESDNEFDKAQSLTDIADAMEVARQILKERQNKIYQKSDVSDTEGKPIKSNLNCSNIPTSTETLTESKTNLLNDFNKDLQQKLQIYIPLSTHEETLNQKPPICPTPDRKSSKPPTKESTPNRLSPMPLQENNSLDKSHLEDLLTALANEARETSEKLGNDLKLLEEESRKCSPRLSQASSPAPDDKPLSVPKTIDEKLSVIDAVSEHAKLCEKLLGCVVESTKLISHSLPEVNMDKEATINEKVDDIPSEPKVYKSIANVIVTIKADAPPTVTPTAEMISETEHDYENIHEENDNKEERTCVSPFEEQRTKLVADFQELKKDLFDDTTTADKVETQPIESTNNDDKSSKKLQDECCSEEGEVCRDIVCLASNTANTEFNNNLNSPHIAFISTAEFDSRENTNAEQIFTNLRGGVRNYFDKSNIGDDSEHSSGFHTESQGSSTANSSLNPLLDINDSQNLSDNNISPTLNDNFQFESHRNFDMSNNISVTDTESQNLVESQLYTIDNLHDITQNSNELLKYNENGNYIYDKNNSVIDDTDIIHISKSTDNHLTNTDVQIDLLDDLVNHSNEDVSKLLPTVSECTDLQNSKDLLLQSTTKLLTSNITDDLNNHSIKNTTKLPYSTDNIDAKTSTIVKKNTDLQTYRHTDNSINTDKPSTSTDDNDQSQTDLRRKHSKDDSNEHLDSSTISWYRDPASIALACSYGLTFLHQLAFLDLVTLLGILLAIVTVFAVFVL